MLPPLAVIAYKSNVVFKKHILVILPAINVKTLSCQFRSDFLYQNINKNIQ